MRTPRNRQASPDTLDLDFELGSIQWVLGPTLRLEQDLCAASRRSEHSRRSFATHL